MSKIDKNLTKVLVNGFVNTLFSKGVLTENDLLLSEDDFWGKVRKVLDNTNISVTTDYRSDILTQANNFWTLEQYEFAKVFFAMFFEHSLNGMVERECQKRNLDEKIKTDIIKNITIHGKLTWLPQLLGYRVFNINHVNTIKKLADDRNSFIHYKWKPEPDDIEITPNEKKANELKKIKLAIRYMRMYESHINFQKSKKKLSDKLKKRQR